MTLQVLYRGPLESCNYGCAYCPFAKRIEDPAARARDEAALERFVDHVAADSRQRWAIFFTPWGEALVRTAYQRAIGRLTRMAHVERVALQTNLSVSARWLRRAEPAKVGLWCTFHPTETDRGSFVRRVLAHRAAGATVSVGVVGMPAHLAAARALREALPEDVYLWINAAKRTHGAYDEALRSAFRAIDPHFETNTFRHRSRGEACATGWDTISVDGRGDVRRCHFVPEVLGNLYDGTFAPARRPCPNETCGCHIGYVHLDRLGLRALYGSGLLERSLPTSRRLPVVGAPRARIASTCQS
ncbi:MAG: radical SAM protein [Sandaracinus sp.]|nr:radical SAM protein [Sandaracinus sp.]MAR57316.1 radical SAM protein [Rickettsiales bacterium]|tara:strand:- start:129 stop:1031 length:903 start_codon:yes stop_codon:yes gene_type:complete